MASLDDIWDIPADEIETVPAKNNAPLFLPSDESDNDAGPTASSRPSKSGNATTSTRSKQQPSREEIDAMFADIDVPDGFQELAPALDLDVLRRQADARNAHKARPAVPASRPTQTQTQSQYKGKGKDRGAYALEMDGGDEGEDDKEAGQGTDKKKKRKPIPKMDEARLLGKDGFPALIKTTKDWKPRGKGHEAADLNQVLQIYQFWTARMYPKTRFRDTVDRVERLCHSKRMHVALSVWRDESKGLIHGKDFNDDDALDISSDDEVEPSAKRAKVSAASGPSDVEDVMEMDSDGEVIPSRPPSHGPPSSSPPAEEEYDLDALIAAEEAAEAVVKQRYPAASGPSKSQNTAPTASTSAYDMDADDDAMWDALDAMDFDAPAPQSPPQKQKPVLPQTNQNQNFGDEDEDMWDIMREMEQEAQAEKAQAQAKKPVSSAGPAVSGLVPHAKPVLEKVADEHEWDDMYD